ncbi:MAG TPA: chemotaxis protein CheW [Gemmatimonadaceae bacterium]|jgi:purine-binding chemotaxis protein CheW|nr:chemotaxis protein CheW [Gemmatimonadaceae bacterium]
MRRLRRKTPHEPVRAIPAPAERGADALPVAGRERRLTPRSLALALNEGKPRPKALDADLPGFEEPSAPAAPVAPFRDRVAERTGRAELLVFRLGGELFATELRAVEEAVEGVTARTIPDTPPAMLGIFALRDRTLPMYALAHVLDVPGAGGGEMTLVLRPSSMRIALAVDAVDDVFEAALGTVRPAPAQEGDGMVLGVVWRGAELITLLDADLVVAACMAAAPVDSL